MPVPGQREAGSTARLRRGGYARAFAGFWLQPVLTMTVLLVVALQIVVPIVAGFSAVGELPVSVVFVAFWGVGVTAWAEVDDIGVRWRYFRRYAATWQQVEHVRLGYALQSRPGTTASGRALFVRLGGVEHRILPAFGCPPSRLDPFAQALVATATRHGVQVTASGQAWSSVAAGRAGVRMTGHLPPGRIVSRRLRVSRTRLTGLALLALAGCAAAGAFGYETPGTGARIGWGVFGVVMLVTGLLLIAFPGQ